MTVRECYNRVLRFESATFIPNLDFGPINKSMLDEWRAQGMPADADFGSYFGIHRLEENAWSIRFDPIPGVADQGVVEETDSKIVRRDQWGSVTESPKDDAMAEGARHVVRNGIENRADWEKLKGHFRADEPKRYPDHWDEDEALVEEIMETRTQLALDILGRAFDEVDFDVMHFWEDIAFNGGPILSPEMFERLAVPRYRRLSDLWRSKGGQVVSVDSDGDIRKLIPGWLRGGVNHFWPMEVNAGMDVVALRKEYGRDFSMRGGIDKYALRGGREAIDRELDRVAPVVADGGYIPSIDHQIPNGVRFEDYCYYMEKKKQLLGLPA